MQLKNIFPNIYKVEGVLLGIWLVFNSSAKGRRILWEKIFKETVAEIFVFGDAKHKIL